MADHKKQHFVPRFYLKWFTSNDKIINLYNWKQQKAIYNAPLKNQCYVDNFYGADGRMESTLASIEGIISDYFRAVHKSGVLPDRLNEHHDALLFWIVLQSCRTPYAADLMNEVAEKMAKATLEHHKDVTQEMLNSVKIQLTDAVKAAIGYKAPAFPLLRDLHMKLVGCPNDTEFITSDTPVASHNQMMRWRSHIGNTTGLIWKGLQIFYPLSSRVLLMLYDPNAYVVGDRNHPWHFITDKRDVEEINVFTAAHSYENIYFHSGASNFLKVAERAKGLRRKEKAKLHKSPITKEPDDKSFSQVIAGTLEEVQMDMRLSFVRLNKQAKKWVADAKLERMMPAVVPRSADVIAEWKLMRKERKEARAGSRL